jgi:hypothetical protein
LVQELEGIRLSFSFTVGTVIVSLAIFVLFAFGAARAEKVVAAKAKLTLKAQQTKLASKLGKKK